MRQPFENIPTVLTSEEIINKALRESTKVEVQLPRRMPAILKAKKREFARIRTAEEISAGYLEHLVKSFPTLEDVHPFYKDILEITFGVGNAKALLGRISRTARIIREISRSSLSNLRRAGGPADAARVRRAFMGRLSSLLRGLGGDLSSLSSIRERMKDLPAADPDVPTVILAGYPGVGKSTIVRAVSSAKPEVRSYPFTTKEVIIGHIERGWRRLQIVDTPGLLDRPLERRSNAELLAITALSRLPGIVAFIVDVSESNGFTLKDQRSLYDDLRRTLAGSMLVFFNKIDISTASQISSAEELFGQSTRIVATRCEGLEDFINEVFKAAVERERG
ncbi:MAG: NOG1 family protein [Candidatus Methanomethylicaceae archaeon]